jgi:hypothetical protein
MRTLLGVAVVCLLSSCATAVVGQGCLSDQTYRYAGSYGSRSREVRRASRDEACGALLLGALAFDLLTLRFQQAWLEELERETLRAQRAVEVPWPSEPPLLVESLAWPASEPVPADSRWRIYMDAGSTSFFRIPSRP